MLDLGRRRKLTEVNFHLQLVRAVTSNSTTRTEENWLLVFACHCGFNTQPLPGTNFFSWKNYSYYWLWLVHFCFFELKVSLSYRSLCSSVGIGLSGTHTFICFLTLSRRLEEWCLPLCMHYKHEKREYCGCLIESPGGFSAMLNLHSFENFQFFKLE